MYAHGLTTHLTLRCAEFDLEVGPREVLRPGRKWLASLQDFLTVPGQSELFEDI